ncbi:DNA topoisomerase IV [Cecembia calidifontis]|uniref:DNA topoisomerase IV subunit B n=1 Tax=Cecembia calidifontis TaxID=1187080 RepID=A0A4V2F6T5_9BACT|nr:DNA topoisomerase IV [Cecembia calidifontis]RZS97439.1 hypothetical protein BC751_3046 [Cecembia calidifontis]
MYYRFGKAFHFLSVLFFLVSFLYIYSALPEVVTYELNEEGVGQKFMTKGTFFYSGIIFFLILNLILITPGKMIENQSTPNFKRLFPTGDQFRDYILTWIYSFVGVINVSLSILALFIHSINNQNEIASGDFAFFFYLIPIFFVVWIVALFWILFKKFNSIQDQDQ